MNNYQTTLYNNLMALITNDAFYYHDYPDNGTTYRIFNYRLASYTDFLLPDALECRGIMFEVVGDTPIRLASLPMQKFFNLNENPMTMNLDLTKVTDIELKADGSLMSTYIDNNGCLKLKSKGSISSEQAIDAMIWLNLPQNATLKSQLHQVTSKDITVNMEWCSSRIDHRIVIGHQQSYLTVLNARDNTTGRYVDVSDYPSIKLATIQKLDISQFDKVQFVNNIGSMKDIEGYIVTIGDTKVKIKTEWYLTQHRAKDGINSDRRLFEAVIEESVDDLRSLFAHDQHVINRIDEMQNKTTLLYNNMVKTVETFYNDNKHLSRKEYAIKGQQTLGMYFGLAINTYIGKPVDYKQFLKDNWKKLGIKDNDVVDNTIHD